MAKQLAAALLYRYIDSGAMYRAVTLAVLESGISLESTEQLDNLLRNIDINIEYPHGHFRIYLEGNDVTERIKKMDVSSRVSELAAISSVRKKLVELQQKMGESKSVVMDGRDIGTVVFPDAELKLFVTADLETRTERRYQELKAKANDVDRDEVSRNLVYRDHIDSTRQDSPLLRAKDAVLIDNSLMTREEQLHLAKKLALEVIESV